MAVFTKLNQIEIENFVKTYEVGKLNSYDEIVEGIENTNYKIICNGNPYVLTIFEKRVKEEDIPFFINLKLFLNNNNFKCPKPIKNKNGKIINSIRNKKAVIISFIEGEKINSPNYNECFEVGKMIGNLHNITVNFNQKRNNSLDIAGLKKIFYKCEKTNNNDFAEIFILLKNEIAFLEKSLPNNLPSGIVHADLFKDNIFFKNEKITGVIDFYFSCYHFLLYDISIVINDWCFENNGNVFIKDFYKAIFKGYNESRSLNNEELKYFNLILRIAALRILITRLHDYIFHPNDAIVIKKDPYQYFNILKWHKNNSIL